MGEIFRNQLVPGRFFYSRYDEPKGEDKLKAKVEFQKLFYHRIGTAQAEDRMILNDPERPMRGFSGYVTEDEKYLIIDVWEGSADYNLLYYKNLLTDSPIRPVIDESDARFQFIGELGGRFMIVTDSDAKNSRVISIDPLRPEKTDWKLVIPETDHKLETVSYVGGRLIANYLRDATSAVSVYDVTGTKILDVELPGIGSVYGFDGRKLDTEVFYTFTSFTQPPAIYRYDIDKNTSQLFRKPVVKFEADEYETHQVFCESRDGTRVPVFLVYKKGLEFDSDNPALLYGYGGFNISMTPGFVLPMIPLLENGGIYALACLRGGGEYGEDWHKAGMLENKQNVFDDFIAAAEYLIENRYTSSRKMAVYGASNGGLLVGAVMTQRPELFQAAVPAVGVLDMLRFHKFTIGWAWVSEYGSSDDKEQFEYLIRYSPLHQLKEGVSYPATLVTTADHDDRVFPAHSFKFISTLQKKNKGNRPVLIRIETKVGHGAGTSTSKSIDLYTDIHAFLFENLGIKSIY